MTDLESQLGALKSQLATAESEYQSLKAGRKSAGPRLRKSLMALKTGSHAMRAGTTSFVRDLPTKSRKKADVQALPEPVAVPEVVAEVVPVKKPTKSRKKTVIPESSD